MRLVIIILLAAMGGCASIPCEFDAPAGHVEFRAIGGDSGHPACDAVASVDLGLCEELEPREECTAAFRCDGGDRHWFGPWGHGFIAVFRDGGAAATILTADYDGEVTCPATYDVIPLD